MVGEFRLRIIVFTLHILYTTVLGEINKSELGITLPHEHVTHHNEVYLLKPKLERDQIKIHWPWTLENVYWIRQNPYTKIFVFIYLVFL